MTGKKQILLAGFAALCMVLPACRSKTAFVENVESPLLVDSDMPLNTVSYTADYTQDGALPFSCEVSLGTDGRIRRDYAWKDENGAEKKVSVVIDGAKAVRLEDGKTSPVRDIDTAKARFYAGLVLSPDSVISNADRTKETGTFTAPDGVPCNGFAYVLKLVGVPDMESCLVATDPETNRWSVLFARMADGSGTVFSTRFLDYKTESGVTFPSQVVSTTDEGAPVRCVIRDVKINPELPDELFRLPANS